MFTVALDIRKILTELMAQRRERGERRLIVHADNTRLHTARVTRALAMTISCELHYIHDIHYTRRTDLPLSFFLSFLRISKNASKDNNPDLQMKFFRESEKFWTKSELTL
jgi:hypothetical protein